MRLRMQSRKPVRGAGRGARVLPGPAPDSSSPSAQLLHRIREPERWPQLCGAGAYPTVCLRRFWIPVEKAHIDSRAFQFLLENIDINRWIALVMVRNDHLRVERLDRFG